MIIIAGILLLYGYSTTTINGDIVIYQKYANNFWYGSPDASMLPKEYPILSLAPMLLPLITGASMYNETFNFIFLVLVFGIYLFLFYLRSKSSAFVFLIYILVGSIGLVLSRLDLIIGAIILLSLFEANHKRFISAYILLALGAMFKIVPILLVLPLFLEEQRFYQHSKIIKRFYGLGVFAVVCFVIFLASLAIDVNATFSPLKYGIERPIQIESIPASIIHSLSRLNFIQTCSFIDFGSLNIGMLREGVCNPPNNDLWNLMTQKITLILILTLICGLMYMVKLYKARRITLSQMYIIVLLLILSTSKVFSPQYMLWILPLIAYVHGFDKKIFSITAILSVLTTIVFPILYSGNTLISISSIQLEDGIFVRNLVFIVFAISYIFNIFNIRESQAHPQSNFKQNN
jgi:hypothetical protein